MRHYRQIESKPPAKKQLMKYFKVKLLPNGWHVIDTSTNITCSLHGSIEEAQAAQRLLQHNSKRSLLLESQVKASLASLAKRKKAV